MVPLSPRRIFGRRFRRPNRVTNMCEYGLPVTEMPHTPYLPRPNMHRLVRPPCSLTLFGISNPHRCTRQLCQEDQDPRRRVFSRRFITRRQARQFCQDSTRPYTLPPSTSLHHPVHPSHLSPLCMTCISDTRRQARQFCQEEDPDRRMEPHSQQFSCRKAHQILQYSSLPCRRISSPIIWNHTECCPSSNTVANLLAQNPDFTRRISDSQSFRGILEHRISIPPCQPTMSRHPRMIRMANIQDMHRQAHSLDRPKNMFTHISMLRHRHMNTRATLTCARFTIANFSIATLHA
jgi:hypothetical protein